MFDDLIVYIFTLHTNLYTKHAVIDDTIIIHVVFTCMSVALFPWLLLYCNCEKELTVTDRMSSAKWWSLLIDGFEWEVSTFTEYFNFCWDGSWQAWITGSLVEHDGCFWLILSKYSVDGNMLWKAFLCSHCYRLI